MRSKKIGAARSCVLLLSLLIYFCAPGRMQAGNLPDDIKKDRDSITVELQRVLDDEFRLWYPLSIDTTYGGYFSDITINGNLTGYKIK